MAMLHLMSAWATHIVETAYRESWHDDQLYEYLQAEREHELLYLILVEQIIFACEEQGLVLCSPRLLCEIGSECIHPSVHDMLHELGFTHVCQAYERDGTLASLSQYIHKGKVLQERNSY